MLKVDGTQSIRAILKWTRDVLTVFRGLAINQAPIKYTMIQEMCSGGTLTAFNAGCAASMVVSWNRARQNAVAQEQLNNPRDIANGETEAQFAARLQVVSDAVQQPAVADDNLNEGYAAVLIARCPYKVLEKQKRFMRRKMRKPFGMTTRTYVNHLTRINSTELPFLPPFRGNDASFNDDEFKEIILFGIPNRWKKDMDKFDFDPFAHSVNELVDFCERMEASDDTGGDEKGNSNESPKKKSKSSKTKFDKYSHRKKKGDGDKWCDYHETDTHTTAECTVLKKLKASKGDGGSAKKQWKNKSDYAKDKAKKELNTLKKKAKAVKKELNATTKAKRKNESSEEEDDDSSFHSVNMLEESMRDVDEQLNALEFSDTEEGEIA